MSNNNSTGTDERLYWSFPVINLCVNAVISPIFQSNLQDVFSENGTLKNPVLEYLFNKFVAGIGVFFSESSMLKRDLAEILSGKYVSFFQSTS